MSKQYNTFTKNCTFPMTNQQTEVISMIIIIERIKKVLKIHEKRKKKDGFGTDLLKAPVELRYQATI